MTTSKNSPSFGGLLGRLFASISGKDVAKDLFGNNKINTAFDKLSTVIRNLNEFNNLLKELELCRDRLKTPLQVAVVGEYNSGKSTFLNAIIGDEVLPVGNLPTTGCITHLCFGKQPSVIVRYIDGRSESIELHDFKQLSSHNHLDTNQQALLNEIKYIEVFYPADILIGSSFIDTPGLNAPTEADREITYRMLAESDAIVWITSALQVLSATEIEVLKDFDTRYRGKSLCAISQVDTLDNPDQEIAMLLKHAERTLSEYFTDIVAVSARSAIQGNRDLIMPFYEAFNNEIVPRSEAIKLASVLEDAKNSIQDEMDLIEKTKNKYSQLSDDLEIVKSHADNEAKILVGGISNCADEMAHEFGRLRRALVTRIQGGLSTWTDYEPFEKTIEGIIWDDQVVDYNEIQRWYWPEGGTQMAENDIREKSKNVIGLFFKDVSELHLQCSHNLEDLNSQFLQTHEDILLGNNTINTIAQHYMISDKLSEFRNLMDGYFWGAMNHGGLWDVFAHLNWDRSTTRPGTDRINGLLSSCLPIDWIIKYVSDLEDLKQGIHVSTKKCYEWLEKDIGLEQEYILKQIEKLSDNMKLL